MDATRTDEQVERRSDTKPAAGRRRVIVERLQPEIDGGRFPIKRTPDETVQVTVDMFADGHDLIAGVLKYRFAGGGGASTSDAERADRPPAAAGTRSVIGRDGKIEFSCRYGLEELPPISEVLEAVGKV